MDATKVGNERKRRAVNTRSVLSLLKSHAWPHQLIFSVRARRFDSCNLPHCHLNKFNDRYFCLLFDCEALRLLRRPSPTSPWNLVPIPERGRLFLGYFHTRKRQANAVRCTPTRLFLDRARGIRFHLSLPDFRTRFRLTVVA